MAAAQGEIEAAPKDATNPHFNRSYADLSAIIGVARPVLARHKIARYQPVWTDDKPGVNITTRLACGGEWVEADLRMPVNKNDAQAVGSAITYGKRYGLAAMLGIATVDDDGEGANNSPPPPEPKQRKSRTSASPSPEPRDEPAPKPEPRLGDTKKGEPLALAIRERMMTASEAMQQKPGPVWRTMLTLAGVDVAWYVREDGNPPADETALRFKDATAVKASLDAKLAEGTAPTEQARTECAKLWAQICTRDPDYKLDNWKAEWATFAQVERWPDHPSASDFAHAIEGMTATLESINS